MRKLVIILCCVILPAHAEEYCAKHKNKIEADHQWKESDFTRENALRAIKLLKDAVEEKKLMGGYASANAHTQIEGFLRKNMIAIQKREDPNDKRMMWYHTENFCNFLTSTPIID